MNITKNMEELNTKMTTFRLAGRLFGVNILDVKEVYSDIEITPIHHANKKIRGYMNIRGQILLVVDLRTDFSFDDNHVDSQSRVIVFKDTVDEPFGILVDSIEDVVTINRDEIKDRRSGEKGVAELENLEKRKARNELCFGVCPLDKELMLVLDSRAILNN